MDLQFLKAFLAVAELKSFSLAADHLHLTQPAISKRIAGFEDYLGVLLFDRIGRSISLTPSGKALVPRAKRILAEIEDTQRSIVNLSKEINGKLSIGTSHHIGLHYLPPVLKSFQNQYPCVTLDLQFMGSEEILDSVHSGKLELGIATMPDTVDEPLHCKVCWEDPLAFVVGKQHALANQEVVTLMALSDYMAILPDKNTRTYQVIENVFASQKLKIKTHMSTNFLETIKMLVSVGLGWSALPTSMISDDLHPLNLPMPCARKLGILSHSNRTLSNAAHAFIRTMENQLAKGNQQMAEVVCNPDNGCCE